MRRFRLLLLAGLVVGSPTPFAAAQPSEAPAPNRVDLLTLDPGSGELARWSHQEFVPDSYFRADLLHLIDNGLNHTSQLRLSRDLGHPILVVENALGDGESYPVTLSLGDGKGTWQNFLVGFDASGRLDLSLARAVELLDSSLAGTRGRAAAGPRSDLRMRVIGGAAYDAYLFDGGELVTQIAVAAPRRSRAEKASPGSLFYPPSCCGPNMGFDYHKVRITAENNVSVNAWATMAVDTVNAQGCQLEWDGSYWCVADSYFRVDYPNKGTVFHRPDYGKTAECWWRITFDSWGNPSRACYAYPALQEHATWTRNDACVAKNDPTDKLLQEHSWDRMVAMMNNTSVTGTATATKGCQKDGTWTVKRVAF